jgi:hypothetical protein
MRYVNGLGALLAMLAVVAVMAAVFVSNMTR